MGFCLVFAHMVSYSLYRWECAIRSAAILGLVGAGLGQQIELSMRMFQYHETSTILIIVFVLVTAVDHLSTMIRKPCNASWWDEADRDAMPGRFRSAPGDGPPNGQEGSRMDQNIDKTICNRSMQMTTHSLDPGRDREVSPDHEWDAGDMGCGELVFHLSTRLKPMRPGQLLKLTARDLGVPQDLPAWCRLTGHHLTYANHPIYLLRRRED